MHVCVYTYYLCAYIQTSREKHRERGREREGGAAPLWLCASKQASKQERERESARERERDKAGHLINRRVVGRAKGLRVVATAPMPGRKKREMEILTWDRRF